MSSLSTSSAMSVPYTNAVPVEAMLLLLGLCTGLLSEQIFVEVDDLICCEKLQNGSVARQGPLSLTDDCIDAQVACAALIRPQKHTLKEP